MLEAVLFDWGDTLMHWRWDDALVEAGHRAGLAAIGLEPVPALTDLFRSGYLPLLAGGESLEEVEYAGLVRSLLGEAAIDVDDAGLDAFLAAEHDAWEPARQLGAATHALLESLRDRGLRLGLVSNAIDPPWLLHRDLDRLGIRQRIDTAVFSSEVGWRKPHPAIFERALETLGADPARTLFVGDSLAADVAGAGALGMTTVQAVWFHADGDPAAPEPDHVAFTPMDVLNIASRLR
ncbi:MAG TPA: HAD family hydrolase [Gaiellaceae bacterium]